ncbi:hypothetical protein BN7_5236 [Wickerhamomyces ciferrii]|uniref:Uncharacterized protein n=1 Tax=Wickerhamomyces ciferrii (strain ATCC 14091 / BCRC 22168 / CBS 111 / JCM 3599 / NBRC 0793 / NRRL Y-1031 F-60-10) TaxID=1206466 RepID=K0KR67_WICCF|nr:uncharacterized protein BN7_5236 [Wickerhamomyces ciferrii]CCH45651.1 hypothetical protein BN7_5236 [Wickerhamomyces ciferrii]
MNKPSIPTKIYKTISSLWRGDCYQAVEIWVEEPSLLDMAVYEEYEIYHESLLRKIWRFNRMFLPVRYYSTIPFKVLFRLINTIAMPIRSLWVICTQPFISIKRISRASHDTVPGKVDVDNMFPVEILELIAKYGDLNPLDMMMINKPLLCIFAPRVYDTLHLTIVISILRKMKLNDECFLKHGPDNFDKTFRRPIDSYSIYERNKKSKHFDYEFLNTDILDSWKGKGIQINSEHIHCHPQAPNSYDRNNNPMQVRSYEKIKHILKHTIQNPKSIMKKFISEVLIDICILDGYDKLFNEASSSDTNPESSKSTSQLIEEVESENQNCSVYFSESSTALRIAGIPFDDNFNRERWRYLQEFKARHHKFAFNALNRAKPLYDIYPNVVYFKELIPVFLLSEKIYSHKLRRRLFNIQDSQSFIHDANPLKHWGYTIIKTFRGNFSEKERLFKLFISGQISVDVQSRKFETKKVVNGFLNDLIQAFTTDSNGLKAKTSILIMGIDNCKPQLTEEFTRNASYSEARDQGSYVIYKPSMVLINKQATY